MSGRTPASERRGRRTLLRALLAGGALLLTWAGCTVTAENYEVLSFFFDGVPDPNAPFFVDGRADLDAIRQSPTYSIHQPFAEDRCADCHERRFNLGPKDSALCLKCHEGVPDEQPRMHGPVAAVACLWCHTAHESPYAALMKGPAREVCSSCHEPRLLGASTVPEHQPDSAVSCLDCHYGHGGATRHFLRTSPAGPPALGGDTPPAPPQAESEPPS